MTFFILITAIFKGILFLIVNHVIWAKIVMLISTICFYYYIRSYLYKPKVVTLLSYKISSFYAFIMAIITFALYILLILGNLLIYRILSVGNTLDLRIILNKIQVYIHTTSIFNSLVDILLVSFCVLCIIKLYTICKCIFKKEFIKLNLYCYHKFNNFGIISHYALYHEIFPARYIYKFFKKFMSLNSKDLLSIKAICKNFGIILLITCFLYDLIFNHFVLSKIYYVFPFVFLYTQWQLFGSFYTSRDILSDQSLSSYYYKKHHKTDSGIFLETGSFLNNEDLKDLHDYILRDFTPQISAKPSIIIDSKQ